MAKGKKVNFEKSLDELTKIVETLEKGDLNLEASLKQFETGIQLTRACQTALKDAEQTVQQLTEDDTLESHDQ